MRTALFVDFDNIYLSLRDQDKSLAESFATNTVQWISWLEQSLPCHQSNEQNRRILVRRCYLNPSSFGSFRPYFMKAAFETIDCPALTARGKTSADVYMVLDMLDLLRHEISYDEYIIMSADADFTPVLLKLRKWDIRTTILAVGPSSPAYRATADIFIDQERFYQEALQLDGIANKQKAQQPTAPAGKPGTPEHLGMIAREIIERVQSAPSAVTMAVLASLVRSIDPTIANDWAGTGSFKSFLLKLDLKGLALSHITPGYVFDPRKHTSPMGTEITERENDFRVSHPEIEPLARRIHEITDMPYLSPEHYRTILENLASEVNENGFNMNETCKAVRDRCRDANLQVGRQHINFLVMGIRFAGHQFEAEQETASSLAEPLIQNTLSLCERTRLELSSGDIEKLRQWLGASIQ